MTDLSNFDDRALIISADNVPFTAYQAIYHKLTRKVEVLSRTYKDPYQISATDIQNLCYRFKQIMAQYAVKGDRLQITHAVKDGFTTSYSSLEKLGKADLSVRECTSSFDLELDFLIVLPAEIPEAENIAQRYKVNLNFQRSFESERDIFTPYYMDLYRSRSSFFMRIEYSDYAVAQTLNATISTWLNGIPKGVVGPKTKFALDHEEFFSRHFPALVASVAPISTPIYLQYRQPDVIASLVLITISLVLASLTSGLSAQVVENGYNTIRRVGPDVEFLLTLGDNDRLKKNSKRSDKIRNYTSFAFTAVFVSLLVNLLSSWLYDWVS